MVKTIAFHTLGCKLNFAETSSISRDFKAAGFTIVNFSEEADIYVIHTCSVTSAAEKKCRQTIRQARKRSPEALVAVIGCYSELRSEDIRELDSADIILGNNNKHKLLEYVMNREEAVQDLPTGEEDFFPAWSSGDRTRSFLKIQDGCDYFCAYCTVPHARGRSRSTSIQNVVKSAREIAATGIKEIVLTGVNIGDFGRKNGQSLNMLLKEFQFFEGIERLRISSIEPDLLSEELIRTIAGSSIIAPHFHISLQSGSDKILKAMGRKYDTALFRDTVNTIKNIMPTAFIAADVITGFPGEDETEFLNTENFISQLPLSELHVFTYSERPGTRAVKMEGRVREGIRTERTKTLITLSNFKKKEFYESNIGTEHFVLWETSLNKGMMSGYTENYLRVVSAYDKSRVNNIENVILKDIDTEGRFRII